MSVTIRAAVPPDIGAMVPLLVADAHARERSDPVLWPVAEGADDRASAALTAALNDEHPPFRQQWLVAEDGGAVVGVAHTILLPVPPIYAGAFGPPGLIMEDCTVSPEAPEGTMRTLLWAAERDLTGAGAQVLLASSVAGGAWAAEYVAQGYAPLTHYFASSALRASSKTDGVRPAQVADVPGIVRQSAVHRRILNSLDRFWEPHGASDARFGAWMEKSLTLPDRDMFVSDVGAGVTGYAISQPATSLHFPPSHDISTVGVIDDFHHGALVDPTRVSGHIDDASALFRTAEGARAARGGKAVLVVCPAAWRSKAALLETEHYRNAITWYRKG
ncbi:MAG: hypothetical protein AAFP16_13065 [Pseudomonadota bacterium]